MGDAQVIHGNELLVLGWNNTVVTHWPLHEYGVNNSQQLDTNIPLLARAFDNLGEWIKPRCCGC